MKNFLRLFFFSFILNALSFQASAKEKSKFMRIKANPFTLAFLDIDAGIDFKVHDKISLGVLGSYITTWNAPQWSAGIQGNFALGHKTYTDGFALRTRLLYKNYFQTKAAKKWLEMFKTESIIIMAPATAPEGNAAVELVYEWFWKNGFNVNLGIGANYSTKNTVNLSGEFSLGFAF